MTINREPLGIRKLDVQAVRRERRREHKVEAERTFEFWFGEKTWRREPMPMTRENIIRFGETLLENGWTEGVHDGAKATRERVAESLANGRLVKTD